MDKYPSTVRTIMLFVGIGLFVAMGFLAEFLLKHDMKWAIFALFGLSIAALFLISLYEDKHNKDNESK